MYCADETSFNEILKVHSNVELIKDDDNYTQNICLFNTHNFAKVVSKKWVILEKELLKHEIVLFTDGDVVFERPDVFDHLITELGDNDMIIQNDKMIDTNADNLCTGFFMVKRNVTTQKIFCMKHINEIFKINNLSWDNNKINDQQIFNKYIKAKLKLKILPIDLFPNGAIFYKNHTTLINPFIIHFNHVSGHEKKIKMKSHKKWYR